MSHDNTDNTDKNGGFTPTPEEQKFYDMFPGAQENLISDIQGKRQRFVALQQQQDILEKQFKLVSTQIQTFTALGAPIPPALTSQLNDLSSQLAKVGQDFMNENSNVNPVPPTPKDANDIPLQLNGETVKVDQNLYMGVKNGDPGALKTIMEAQKSDNPNVRKDALAIAHAVGQDFFDVTTNVGPDGAQTQITQVPQIHLNTGSFHTTEQNPDVLNTIKSFYSNPQDQAAASKSEINRNINGGR